MRITKLNKCVLISALLFALTACTTTSNNTVGRKPATSPAAVSYNPTAANDNVQLGMAYLQQGDVQRAKSKLLLALAQDPNSPQTQDAMGYFLESSGETQQAERYYQKAVQLNPTSGSAQNNYGTYLCRMGRYQAADQHFMLAVQDINYLNTAAAYENAGLCAMQIPNSAKAMAYFQKAIAQDPRRATSVLELGQLYFQQGNTAQAQQYLNNYMQLVQEPSPEALWLGIRLARLQNDNATAGRYALMLQTKYPDSAEFKQLLASQAASAKNANNTGNSPYKSSLSLSN